MSTMWWVSDLSLNYPEPEIRLSTGNNWGNIAMADDEHFVDYYKILQVNPNCDARKLETSYHRLAKMYHPDHIETADVTSFNEVIEAYRALRNPDERDAYDLLYAGMTGFKFHSNDEEYEEEKIAISDGHVHAKIFFFYTKEDESMLRMPELVAILCK